MLGWREWNTIIHFWCKLVPLSDAITERSIAWGFLSALGASPMQRSVFLKRDRTHLCSTTTVRRLYGPLRGPFSALSYLLFTVVPLRAMAAAVRLDARLSNPFAWVLLLNLSSFWLIFCFTLLMFISCYNNIGIPLSFDLADCPHP